MARCKLEILFLHCHPYAALFVRTRGGCLLPTAFRFFEIIGATNLLLLFEREYGIGHVFDVVQEIRNPLVVIQNSVVDWPPVPLHEVTITITNVIALLGHALRKAPIEYSAQGSVK